MDFRALNIEVNIQPFYSCKKYTSHHTSQRNWIIVSFFPFSSCFVFFLFHVMFSLPEGYRSLSLSLSHTHSKHVSTHSHVGCFLWWSLLVNKVTGRPSVNEGYNTRLCEFLVSSCLYRNLPFETLETSMQRNTQETTKTLRNSSPVRDIPIIYISCS